MPASRSAYGAPKPTAIAVIAPKGWGNKKRLAKSSRTKRSYADFFDVPASVAKAVKTMLPYGLR